MPDRPPVRTQPFGVPRELAGRFRCATCGASISTGLAHVVHIDAHRNGRNEIKAHSHIACGPTCLEELHGALTVEHALVGVQNERNDTEDDDGCQH